MEVCAGDKGQSGAGGKGGAGAGWEVVAERAHGGPSLV